MRYKYLFGLIVLLPCLAFSQSLQERLEQALIRLESDTLVIDEEAYAKALELYARYYPQASLSSVVLSRIVDAALKNGKHEQAFVAGLKLYHLYNDSEEADRVYRQIDSLLTYHVEWGPATDVNKIMSGLDVYQPEPDLRLSYANFIAFLQELEYRFIPAYGLKECENFRILFKDNAKHHDAVLFWQAGFQERSGLFHEALLNYRLITEMFPDSPFHSRSSLRMAWILNKKMGKPAVARNLLVDVINRNPDSEYAGEAQYRLALLYDNDLKDKKEALTQYRVYVRTFPEGTHSDAAHLRLAQLSSSVGSKEEALAMYSELVETSSDTASIIKALTAMIELQQKHFKMQDKAARSYVMLASYSASPDQAVGYLANAVELYVQAGDGEEARKTLNLLKEQFPGSNSIGRLEKLVNGK